MIQSGKTLSMTNEAIWKGTYTDNGMLLKIHENAFTIGYSKLLSADGSKAGVVKFGDGVFYNAADKDNTVYAGAPTASGAKAVFAGIMVREPAIASGYPVNNDEVAAFQMGLLAKEGFVIYKNAKVCSADKDEDNKTIATLTETRVNTFENVNVGAEAVVSMANGEVYFSVDGSLANASDQTVGKVVAINPDDKSVTVYITPAFYV